MTLWTRIGRAWAILIGRATAIELTLKTDAEADLLQLHARLTFALRYLKDLPMELSNDIAALGTAIMTALAAKQAELAPLQQQVSDLTAQNTALQDQINQASAQLQALAAQIAPPPPVAPQ